MTKLMKRLSIFFVSLLSLLFISCSGQKPQEVTINFLEALSNLNYEQAYGYASSESISFEEFIYQYTPYAEDDMPEIKGFQYFILSNSTFQIVEVEKDHDRAIARCAASFIDMYDPSFFDIVWPAIEQCIGMEDPKEIATKIAIVLSQIDLPRTNSYEVIDLIKENKEWKVTIPPMDSNN